MEEHAPRNAFDIPKVFYFQVGNIHTGSRGKMRYRIEPKEGQLQVCVWNQDICYELAQERGILSAEGAFPADEEGFAQMLSFLEEQLEAPSNAPE